VCRSAVVKIGGSVLALLALGAPLGAQEHAAVPAAEDLRLHDIGVAPSADRLAADIRTLAGFGTRNTFSDTVSATRGIGAARRWIHAEFQRISAECGGCLEVFYQDTLITREQNPRIPHDVRVVNVVAIQRGSVHPDRHIIMSGDIDSRASDTFDFTSDAPGANDNASGMAGVIEAARVLTKYRFPNSVTYMGLSGEEQGLWGGAQAAREARDGGWEIIGVLNNDMIGNITGVNGVTDNTTFRIFSEPVPATDSLQAHRSRRTFGGEVDGPSRQLARRIADLADRYIPNLDPILIYRLDRFGRGGHHRPFNDVGFTAVRIMETNEHYDRQHQDLRVEEGRTYGDVVEGVDFDYAAKLTAVNAVTLASLGWAPPAPRMVLVGGQVGPSTILRWEPVESPLVAGYRVHWRDTTAPRWQHSRYVGNVSEFLLEGLVIDNYLFGVSTVGHDGNESPVVYPGGVTRR
jgi:hypothetical protein